MGKNSHYVVWSGKKPGIYTSWPDCQAQTKGVKGARFKGFPSYEEALEAYESPEMKPQADYIRESISTDVGCSGNPGIMEYKCVDTQNGAVLFHHGPYPKGTNNIGEFLGVVAGLRYLHERGSSIPVYTDSRTAMAWVRDRKIKTTLDREPETEALWNEIDEALDWLRTTPYANPIYKWDTVNWGEIKADFGRK